MHNILANPPKKTPQPPNFSHNITTFNVSLSYDLNGNIMTLDNKNAGGNATASSLAISFIQHEEGRFRPSGSEMPQETSPLAQAASPSKWTSHRPDKFFFSPSLWVGYGAMAEGGVGEDVSRPNGSEMIYEYVLKDHASRSLSTGLGNTRIMLRGASAHRLR